MKVKYQITMEVEVEVKHKTAPLPNITEDLHDYVTRRFNATVDKLVVLKIGATGVTPKDTRHSQSGNPNWDDNGNKYK